MANKHQITVRDISSLLEIINNYPLATVITCLSEAVEISHLPVVAEIQQNGEISISGHLSTRNPQWQHLKSGASMVLVFNGPNTYINSSWYKVDDVSTWNYISVQAEGLPSLEESYEGLIDILKATTDLANRLYRDQWSFNIPDDLKAVSVLTSAIGGFSLKPKKIIGKFKLSQSKSVEDQQQIIKKLSLREDENSKLIAQFMVENFEYKLGASTDP